MTEKWIKIREFFGEPVLVPTERMFFNDVVKGDRK